MADLGSIRYAARVNTGKARGWLVTLTKLGFACKGVVYILIGVLALMTALREGGQTTDQRGAVGHLAEQPFGEFALATIAVGLLAYSVWRFLCAFANAEGERHDTAGAAKRVLYFASAITYLGVAWFAFRMLSGNGGGSGQSSLTARLMQAPGGTWIVTLLGLAVVAGAIYYARYGLKERFRSKLRTGEMSRGELEWATRAGKAGYVARGIVFTIIGLFLAYAGLMSDPTEAKGLEGALDTLAAQPFGRWLLGIVALGLTLFGTFCLVEARYRRIRTTS